VDLSRSVLRRARTNYELNGLAADDRDFVYGDALNWLDRFHKKGRTFDMVIFDPPTFSRNRNRTFSVRKDYGQALEKIDRVAGRYVFTSVNTFSVNLDEYVSWHPDRWEPVFLGHESSDFRPGERPYLKAGLWRKKE
jgi:23S rRNA G2069 N7-methylase RlmK/C1962 C5-methylase RlmI